MSSAVVSPARISQWLAKALGSPEAVLAYGRNTHASFASFDPATSSWRTFQRSLVEDLERYSETWPRSGMTQNGIAFQLPTLAPLTDETESGLWPTPNAGLANYDESPETFTARGMKLKAEGKGPRGKLHYPLGMAVRMWPTPHGFSQNGKSNGPSRNELGRAVNQSLRWATPRASDGEKMSSMSVARRQRGVKTSSLPDQVREQTGTGSLNPTWVEWLMGFPEEWTALDASEMPLSRRSRKSSGAQS